MLSRTPIVGKIKPLTPIPTKLQPKGKEIANIKAVLFDVYGTLFISDSGDIGLNKRRNQNTAAIDRLLANFKISRSSRDILDDFYQTIVTDHEKKKIRGIKFPEIEIDRIWMSVLGWNDQTKSRNFALQFEFIVNPVYPMPGLKRVLEYLRTNRILLGIISNAQFYTPQLFVWFLGGNPVELGFHKSLIIYSYLLGISKPSGTLFEHAVDQLKKLGVSAEQALYLGNDMRNDILPAQRVGFKTALFAGDQRSLRLRKDSEACRNAQPDLIITELLQLQRYLLW